MQDFTYVIEDVYNDLKTRYGIYYTNWKEVKKKGKTKKTIPWKYLYLVYTDFL